MNITGEKNIRWVHMRTQLSALKLEMIGMKHRGGSVYAIIKREYGLSGNRAKVYKEFQELVENSRPTD